MTRKRRLKPGAGATNGRSADLSAVLACHNDWSIKAECSQRTGERETVSVGKVGTHKQSVKLVRICRELLVCRSQRRRVGHRETLISKDLGR